MKKSNPFLFVVIILSFASCKKVLDLDLDNTTSRVVISGTLSDKDTMPEIRISQTINYNDPNNFDNVLDAIVVVKDNLGMIDTFKLQSQGAYRGVTKGTPGHTYSLSIIYDNQEFNSSTKMPQPVTIDSIQVADANTPDGILPLMTTYFQDPGGEENYYYVSYLVNGISRGDYSFLSDDLRDGEQLSIGTLSGVYGANSGNIITVELHSIDASMYEYYITRQALNEAGIGGLGASIPNNPISNITGDALGYFKVYSQTEKDFIIQ